MTADADALSVPLRQQIFGITLARGFPPSMAELAEATGLPEAEVRSGLMQLAGERVVVLQPASGEILMANPFSAVPTPFVVETTGYTAFGNCIWDALGIAVLAGGPATVRTACGCCGESMALATAAERLGPAEGVVHFAVPAARWWQDIVFT
jgi:hypothetical protein